MRDIKISLFLRIFAKFMYRRFLFLAVVFLSCVPLSAQEFRCGVQVNYQKLMNTTQQYNSGDKKVFDNMKQAIEDFVNSRQWTSLEFEQNEKIDCSLSLILTEQSSPTDFKAQVQFQLRRPVYNSNYTTGLFNFLESSDFSFSFIDGQPLDFDPNSFYGNLSSMLAYYIYVMLGYYFDSFAPNGGESFFEMARTICQTAENSGFKGWKSTDGQKARYWFMENHVNSAYASLHSAYYTYHRLGLDMMTKDQPLARANIIQSLKYIHDVHKSRANLLSVQQFIDMKISEIVSIFTPAPPEEQKQIYFIIKEVSPIQVTKMKDFNIK